MAEYMVKIRITDENNEFEKADVKDLVEQMIDAVESAPVGISIDSFENAMPKSVDDILVKGICPHCKKDSLYEDERGEEYITFCCDSCERDIQVIKDDMGIELVVMTWIDESKEEFEDEMEEVIYERDN